MTAPRTTSRPLVPRPPAALAAALAALALLAVPAWATPPDTLALGLADAIRSGLEKNEDVGIASSEARRARAQAVSARSAFLPHLSTESSYQRTIKSPFDDLGSSAALGAAGDLDELFDRFDDAGKNSWSSTLQATQLLFDWQAISNARAATANAKIQGLQSTERELDVTLEIVEAYYAALLAERSVEITTAALDQANRQLDHVRAKHAAGNESDLEVMNVEVQRDNLDPERIAALNALDTAVLNLKRLIGMPAEAPLRLTGALDPAGFVAVGPSTLDRVAAEALDRRAQVQAARRQITIREHQASAVKGERLPSVSLFGSFSKLAFTSEGVPSDGDLLDSWSAGVVVQMSVFDGGRTGAETKAAHESIVQARLQNDQLRKAVTLEVAQQRLELDRAAAAIAARAHTVAQADRTYRLMDLAYSKGVVNTLQLSDARLQLRQARMNEAQALHDYDVTLARLMRVAGQTPAMVASTDRANAISFSLDSAPLHGGVK
jgi:outer membrane protein